MYHTSHLLGLSRQGVEDGSRQEDGQELTADLRGFKKDLNGKIIDTIFAIIDMLYLFLITGSIRNFFL